MTTLADIAKLLSCSALPPAEAERRVAGVASLAEAEEDDLSFVGSDAYVDDLAGTRALAIIVQSRVTLPPSWTRPAFRVDDAELAVAKVLERFAVPVPQPPIGTDPTATIAPTAVLAHGVAVGPHVVVGQRSKIGKGTVLHAGAFVGEDVVIGDDCQIFPNVVIRERITIGNRVTIHAGSVLGTDGFGYRWDGNKHTKVPQVGTVIVEDDVEIGSCVCIDRAKFSATRIGRGTKIDNLVQIGHNAQIGPHCILVGQSGVAGSARLGTGVVLGGQTAVRDHITVGDGAMAAACSAIAEDVEPKTIVSGTPALPHRQSLREQAALRRLPDLVVQVRKLQEAVDELKRQQR
ncbi:MAG TPA: UDP-3-O-(3-hydroxymyristoyl)glucosamine N-acyltransferase [Tepidisphaeraceae bacterium]|nr:UDP-3-O-(3-hydroxymyristoyl)glucosamine N-acyltransferase [Tepidisphaeraceae bacterium]